MELHICHLYPDLLNSYGDVGNIMILEQRIKARGIQAIIHHVSINDDFDADCYDIVLLGGGQDFEQNIVAQDLCHHKKEQIKKYIENNKVFIAICGGYQLLGKYYVLSNGKKIEGLNILDIYTINGEKRSIGNIIIQSNDNYYVGFENHSGKTYIQDLQPLGKVIYGSGNNGEDYLEGCRYKNTIGTYLHGPLFSKNPELCDELIQIALIQKYQQPIKLQELDDIMEYEAKQYILNTYM